MHSRGDLPPEARRDVERVYGRYRSIVDDWAAFTDALVSPLDPVVWAHPTRLDRAELAKLLAAAGMRSTPIPWDGSALSLPGVSRPGLHFGHWAGLYYVQEEASLLPARLLDAQPGERVLDLCAAPGSKTARIALAMQNRGTLVANDRTVQRLSALSASIARLGLVNVTCTLADGTSYPLEAGPFDRVLVDAPCSAEGNRRPARRSAPLACADSTRAALRSSLDSRKNASWRGSDEDFRASISGVQRALLRRAAHLCRAGGRVVYSTCTFAPEENEVVLDAIVRELDGALRVVPVEAIEGLPMTPALDAWCGRSLLPEVTHARRLWPHLSGTGGFFVAVLEKTASTCAMGSHAADPRVAGIDPRASESLSLFRDAFGMDDAVFAGHRLLTSGRLARLVSDDHAIPSCPRVVSTGLPMTRTRAHGAKLSTGGALAFGRGATRRVVELDAAGADTFQARAPIAVHDTDVRSGYVIARVAGHPLGLGLVRERGGALVLESEFPIAWSHRAGGVQRTQ